MDGHKDRVFQLCFQLLIKHELERDTLSKRNEKLEEEIAKVRGVLKQAEIEIRRQDQAIQVRFELLREVTFALCVHLKFPDYL